MAFRFKRKESIAAAFARLTYEQIAEAIAALESSSENGTHVARRCIKRLRSLLRLFRRALPGETCERENGALRNAARKLSAVRDAQVQLIVFEKIARGIELAGVAEARSEFARAVEAAASVTHHASPAKAAITLLRTVRARLPGLKPDSGWPVLARCLKISYRRARKAHAAAHAEPTAEVLHSWRRRCKDFQYQMQLFRKIDPDTLKRRIRKSSRLDDDLGNAHDLAVLDRKLAAMPRLSPELREKLRSRIAKRRKKLQRHAFHLGSELFFEKPSVVVKELARAWKKWRKK